MRRQLLRALVSLVMLAAALVLLAPQAGAEEKTTRYTLIKNVHIFDGVNDRRTPGSVLVENHLIKSVGANLAAPPGATVIDGDGGTLMPGLMDMHTHLSLNRGIAEMRDRYDAWAGGAMASEAMIRMYLMRGFTTVRDAGGATLGLARAVKDGVIQGPRIYSCGAFIGQTSGHGDWTTLTGPLGEIGQLQRDEQTYVVDGVPEILKAVRTNLKQGAAQIKIMGNGGVASDYDPLESLQFTAPEQRAAVEAAADFGTYVMVHAFTDDAVNRALDAGVRSIEHGFLMKEETVKRMADMGAIFSWQAYASMVVLAEPEKIPGYRAENVRKAKIVYQGARKVPPWLKKYKVKVVGGSDLYLYNHLEYVVDDLLVKLEYFSPVEILRMHTSTAGEVCAMSGAMNPYRDGPLGVIREGAYADLLVIDGNPLENLRVLKDEKKLKLIMKDGKVFKNRLD